MSDTQERTQAGTAQFTRMDQSTAEQWAEIGKATSANQSRVADRVMMLLHVALRDHGRVLDGSAHALPADGDARGARRCRRRGRGRRAVPRHRQGDQRAEPPDDRSGDPQAVRAPEVYDMIRVHQDFQGKHYYAHFGGDPNARESHRSTLDADRYTLAERFADEWDQVAFDPSYDTLPLEHFEPKIRKVFGSVAPIGKQAG
jgi:hypothetical protein